MLVHIYHEHGLIIMAILELDLDNILKSDLYIRHFINILPYKDLNYHLKKRTIYFCLLIFKLGSRGHWLDHCPAFK